MSTISARRIYRHRRPVRLMQSTKVICLSVLSMSGPHVFNAHPTLYWGRDSTFAAPLVTVGAKPSVAGLAGVTTIAGQRFVTTGVLGISGLDRGVS